MDSSDYNSTFHHVSKGISQLRIFSVRWICMLQYNSLLEVIHLPRPCFVVFRVDILTWKKKHSDLTGILSFYYGVTPTTVRKRCRFSLFSFTFISSNYNWSFIFHLRFCHIIVQSLKNVYLRISTFSNIHFWIFFHFPVYKWYNFSALRITMVIMMIRYYRRYYLSHYYESYYFPLS